MLFKKKNFILKKEFQFDVEEDGKEVLKIYTFWTKHEILNGMSEYY